MVKVSWVLDHDMVVVSKDIFVKVDYSLEEASMEEPYV